MFSEDSAYYQYEEYKNFKENSETEYLYHMNHPLCLYSSKKDTEGGFGAAVSFGTKSSVSSIVAVLLYV